MLATVQQQLLLQMQMQQAAIGSVDSRVRSQHRLGWEDQGAGARSHPPFCNLLFCSKKCNVE